MRLRFDEDLEIEIPDNMTDSQGLNADTPISSMLKNSFYLREVGLHTGALKSILLNIDTKPIMNILDGMCGVGFGTAIFNKYLPGRFVQVNDLDINCCKLLSTKIQIRNIFNEDIKDLLSKTKNYWDLIYLDFNTFTSKNQEWLNLLKKYWTRTSYCLLFTDTANFGFKFPKNLSTYEVKSPEEYYGKLVDSVVPKRKCSALVSYHKNSAIVGLSKTNSPRDKIDMIKAEPLKLVPQLEGGLFG